jgi:DNA ligase-1
MLFIPSSPPPFSPGEGEVVAIDKESGTILPFQTLSKRSRSSPSSAQKESGVDICFFAFDLLYLDGVSLVEQTLDNRIRLLRSQFKEGEEGEQGSGQFRHVEASRLRVPLTPGNPDEEEALLHEMRGILSKAMQSGHEGLMVKVGSVSPDTHAHRTKGQYHCGGHSFHWLKLKHEYLEGLNYNDTLALSPRDTGSNSNSQALAAIMKLTDTLDLVPVAAFWGKGRKTKYLSSFLMACATPSLDRAGEAVVYQSICRLGGGFSDSILEQITSDVSALGDDVGLQQQLNELYCGSENHGLKGIKGRPIWLPPGKLGVWEVQASDFSLSPLHNAGVHLIQKDNKGLALRFPRFVRVRGDKNLDGVTSAEAIVNMAFCQAG